jgi:hypothetical protein
MNVLTRLTRIESSIDDTKRLLESNDPYWRAADAQSRLSFQLLDQVAEKAMCELELSGYSVVWPNTAGPQPIVALGTRSPKDDELSEFLTHLKLIGRRYPATVIDLQGTRIGDLGTVVRDIKDSCPNFLVRK